MVEETLRKHLQGVLIVCVVNIRVEIAAGGQCLRSICGEQLWTAERNIDGKIATADA